MMAEFLDLAQYLAFISHCKTDTGLAAVFIKQSLSLVAQRKIPGCSYRFFLDSDELHDLERLLDAVKNSNSFVVLLSENYLSRPWCLIELWKAVSERKILVPVQLKQSGKEELGSFAFDFNRAQAYANGLGCALPIQDAENVLHVLESQGATVDAVQSAVRRLLNVIACPFDAAAPENVREAQLENIFIKITKGTQKIESLTTATLQGTEAKTAPSMKEEGERKNAEPAAEALLNKPGWWARTRAGRHEQAQAQFSEAATIAQGLATAPSGLSYVLEEDKLGGPKDGIATYRKAVEADPDNAIAHHNLGIVLREEKDLDGAEACFRRALELQPEYVDALGDLCELLLEQGGRLEEAEPLVRLAFSLSPENARDINNLALVLREEGKLEEALELLRQAVDLDPRDAKIANNLGFALRQKGKLEEAERMYRHALELQPDCASALDQLGTLLLGRVPSWSSEPSKRATALEEVEELLCHAVALEPRDAIKRYNLGSLLEKKGDWAGAEAQYREGMALDPGEPDYARKAWKMRKKQQKKKKRFIFF